jgi:hypothetical protein
MFVTLTYSLHVSAPTDHLQVDYIISYFLRIYLTKTDPLFVYIWPYVSPLLACILFIVTSHIRDIGILL